MLQNSEPKNKTPRRTTHLGLDDQLLDRLIVILDSGVPTEELLESVRQELEKAHDRTFSIEEVVQLLDEELNNSVPIFSPTECLREVAKQLRLLRGAINMEIRFTLIHKFPNTISFIIGDYVPLNGSPKVDAIHLMHRLFSSSPEKVTSRIVHLIESIRKGREEDPSFLLDDDEMETLRQALFLIDKLKISSDMFCEFGQDILNDLRLFISEYEASKQ